MIELVSRFWYLWVFLLLLAAYRLFLPFIKGWFGEKTIALYLSRLPKNEYTVLGDIMLSTEKGTTQIDHIVVSLYGIFVIETKNYMGWIVGNEQSTHWTQNIYGKKHSFMNPIRQNYAHVKALEARLEPYKGIPIIPIIAFSPGCDLKVKTTSPVVYFHRLNRAIRKYSHKVIETSTMTEIAEMIESQSITSSAQRKEHVAAVKMKQSDFMNAIAGGVCPRCAGTLVVRQGKRSQFLGCSNYPKCRFTKI